MIRSNRLVIVLLASTLAIATAWASDTAPTASTASTASATTAAYAPDSFAAAAYEKARAAVADGPNPKAGDKKAIEAGKAKFAILCTTCHGPTGAGDGPAAVALDPHPASFADPVRWKASSPAVKHWILMNGIAGTTMMPLGLTDDDAWNVLAFIESDLVKP